MSTETEFESIALSSLVPVAGKWELAEGRARFIEPEGGRFAIGIALSRVRSTSGVFRATVALEEPKEGCAQFVVGHDSRTQSGIAVGLGGYSYAFSVSTYALSGGSRLLNGVGRADNLQANHPYSIEVRVRGQSVRFSVDGTIVLDLTLPRPLSGDQIGLKGYGTKAVSFEKFEAQLLRPRAFVVMPFSEPYNSLWSEVIEHTSDKIGYEAYRADNIFRPGVVLQDIVRSIVDSEVIIVDVTSENPNVFYELGFTHALGKPTVILAERRTGASSLLPFDIRGFRCIFYENAIRGKKQVKTALKRHLRSIRDGDEGGIFTG